MTVVEQLIGRSAGKWVVLALALLCVPAFAGSAYQQINLVSDISGIAANTDSNLVNPWGIVAGPTSPFWISDNNAGVSTLYDGDGNAFPPPPNGPLVVKIPLPGGACPTPTPANPNPQLAAPTGIVVNGSANFKVAGAPARFIFSSEDGTIVAWNGHLPDIHCAALVADNSANAVDGMLKGNPTPLRLGAVYKGLAIDPTQSVIFATNFRDGVVEMYDSTFKFIGFFTDPHITPDAASPGFAPFGIQTIGNHLYVTFAMQNAQRHDDVKGAGSGFVDEFDFDGTFRRTFASGGALNSPWGLALAPGHFGKHSHQLLVGNFGDGHINAYEFPDGEFKGTLKNDEGKPIFIGGLWALTFGGGGPKNINGAVNELFFTAGIGDETHGLFGKITVDPCDLEDHGD